MKFVEQRDFTQVFGYPTREVLTRVECSSNYSPLKKQDLVPDLNFGHYTGNQDYFGTESLLSVNPLLNHLLGLPRIHLGHHLDLEDYRNVFQETTLYLLFQLN